MDMSKLSSGKVHFINSGAKEFSVLTRVMVVFRVHKKIKVVAEIQELFQYGNLLETVYGCLSVAYTYTQLQC